MKRVNEQVVETLDKVNKNTIEVEFEATNSILSETECPVCNKPMIF